MGGATELALACHYRILSDDKRTRFGLPEIKIGIFPVLAVHNASHD